MATDTLSVKEVDIIRLIESYLEFRGLHSTVDALERETGVLNYAYTEQVLVLRHLIIDGKWRDAVSYIKRLPLSEQDLKFVVFEIMKQKYVELICVYEELGNELYEDLGNAIALCFSELSSYCPCPVEYENLRRLARLTKLSQDAKYKDWDPISSRRQCFATVSSVLLEMQGTDTGFTSQQVGPQRLLDLIVKGLIYESCEEYCQKKSIAQSESVTFGFSSIANSIDSNLSNLSLYSWLQSVPLSDIREGFVHRSLTVQVDKLDKIASKDGWTETILRNSNDLPEDVICELRRPQSSSEDLKERFWNRRIEDNLIVDAPEILKRAEEVIARWEKRNAEDTKLPKNKYASSTSKHRETRRGCYSAGFRRVPENATPSNFSHGQRICPDTEQIQNYATTKPSEEITNFAHSEAEGDAGSQFKSTTNKYATCTTKNREPLRNCYSAGLRRVSDNVASSNFSHCQRIRSGTEQIQNSTATKLLPSEIITDSVYSEAQRDSTDPLKSITNTPPELDMTVEPERQIHTSSVNESISKESVFDDKQNIRDLLVAKEKVREKLLRIISSNSSVDGD